MKMTIIRKWIWMPLLLMPLMASAQSPRYTCTHLEQLATTLSGLYDVDCSRAATIPFQKGRLVVTQDTLRRIDHIGWQIFPEQLMSETPSPVYRFVERYLLELYLYDGQPTPAQRMREDKVRLRFPGHDGEPLRENIEKRLPKFDGHTSLIVLTDNNYYSMSVYQSGKPCFQIRFPIRYELLWGMNKRETENSFYPDLLQFRCPKAVEKPAPLTADEVAWLLPADDGTLQLQGDIYLIESMNNHRSYRRTADGSFLPVFHPQWAEASARNLFLLPCGGEVTASVKQRLYNHRTLEFDVPLHKLLAFFRSTGCQTFVGIETATDKEVTGTVVLLNSAYGYFHQLYFRMNPKLLTHPKEHKLQLELYAYVPTHNIGNMFYEEETKK